MPNQRTLRRPRQAAVLDFERAAVCALLTVLTVVGCGASDGTRSGARPGTPSGDQSGTRAPASDSATPVTAADGTNVAACADGNCEILVSGPVDIDLHDRGGITTLSVVKVDSTGLEFKTTSPGGTGSGEIRRGCTLTLHVGGGGSSCGGEQALPKKETGVLAMQLGDVTNGGVVLRLVSGKPGRPPARLVPPIPTPPEIP